MNSTVPPPDYMTLWQQALPGLRRQVLALLDDEGVVPRDILVVIYGDAAVTVMEPDTAREFLRPYGPLRAIVESLDPDQFPVIMLPRDGKPAITSSRVVPARTKRRETLN
jgi:hypothetical protein